MIGMIQHHRQEAGILCRVVDHEVHDPIKLFLLEERLHAVRIVRIFFQIAHVGEGTYGIINGQTGDLVAQCGETRHQILSHGSGRPGNKNFLTHSGTSAYQNREAARLLPPSIR